MATGRAWRSGECRKLRETRLLTIFLLARPSVRSGADPRCDDLPPRPPANLCTQFLQDEAACDASSARSARAQALALVDALDGMIEESARDASGGGTTGGLDAAARSLSRLYAGMRSARGVAGT